MVSFGWCIGLLKGRWVIVVDVIEKLCEDSGNL